MKKLPQTKISHHGHTLAIIERTDTLGLFSAVYPGVSTHGYIVAKITQSPAGERTLPNGINLTYDAKESLPSEAEYGRAAWFFRCQDEARIHFNHLCEAQRQRLTVKDRVGQGATAYPV
jgi:hypothetical protein